MRQTVSNNARNGKPARRVLFYSHDTFGLGHLRRSRALAAALMDGDEDASAIILTGSPVAGRFTFPKGVDHIRLPGVTKLADGSYVAQTLGLDIDEVTSLRAGLIRTAIEEYTPDLLIVDVPTERPVRSVVEPFLGAPGLTSVPIVALIEPDQAADAVATALERNTISYGHMVGTCPMGPVLDADCRVHGIPNLRVADASVMPTIPRGNTYLGCVMVAERIARKMKAGERVP